VAISHLGHAKYIWQQRKLKTYPWHGCKTMDVWKIISTTSVPLTMFGSIPFMLLIFEGQRLLLGTSYDASLAALPSLLFVLKSIKVKITEIHICPYDTELYFYFKIYWAKVSFSHSCCTFLLGLGCLFWISWLFPTLAIHNIWQQIKFITYPWHGSNNGCLEDYQDQ
jgi:hypothetical protein